MDSSLGFAAVSKRRKWARLSSQRTLGVRTPIFLHFIFFFSSFLLFLLRTRSHAGLQYSLVPYVPSCHPTASDARTPATLIQGMVLSCPWLFFHLPSFPPPVSR